MSKVFFDTGLSLDGYMAGENRGPDNPLGDRGTQIHQWMYRQSAFWKNFGMERGKTDNPDNTHIAKTFERSGAVIMGKRLFEEGEKHWPEDLYKTPVYVLTHEVREPWVQKGSTTFYFVNDGIESALEQARANANGKDIRINGGGEIIRQYLNAGLIDEFTIHIAPIILGRGIRLFDDIDRNTVKVEIVEADTSDLATHITYAVKK